MNDRQLRIAHMIRTGSARPDDLQELADSILAQCHHPPMQSVPVHGDAQSTTGFLLCTLCDKRVQEYSAEEWAIMKSVIGVEAPSADVKAIVEERLAAHAAAGHIDLSKLPPGFGHSWSCTCDVCAPKDPHTVITIKCRDNPNDKRVQYFDPTKFVVECEALPDGGDRNDK